MSLIDRIRSTVLGSTRPLSIASPWSDASHLKPIVRTDILQLQRRSITREEAIRIPALARSRLLIVATIPRLPLVAKDSTGNETDIPAWLVATTGPLSPFHRMLWTIDDLFFYGWSLWIVERDDSGAIIDATRAPYDTWEIDDAGRIIVQGQRAAAEEVILFPGVHEGILSTATETLIEARDLAAAVQRAAYTPSAHTELHQTNDAPMTREQIDALIKRWADARRGQNGGVAYTPASVQVIEHGAAQEHLLLDGRNAAAVEVAGHAGIPATMIDATLSGSSLSYANTSARMSELITFGLSPFMAAVTSRLSQDDVTDPGVTIAYDTKTVIEELRPVPLDERRDLWKDNE
jgi:hypothetical protein